MNLSVTINYRLILDPEELRLLLHSLRLAAGHDVVSSEEHAVEAEDLIAKIQRARHNHFRSYEMNMRKHVNNIGRAEKESPNDAQAVSDI